LPQINDFNGKDVTHTSLNHPTKVSLTVLAWQLPVVAE